MAQTGYWEQKLIELSRWNVDVQLTHNSRITTALNELSRALSNALPDDLQGDVRVAADAALAEVRTKSIALAAKLQTVNTTVDSANSTRRYLAQDGISTLDSYPQKMEWWQEVAVRGAVAGATVWIGPLAWVASDYTADSINNYLANAREAAAQQQVKKISDAMDRYTFDGSSTAPSEREEQDRNRDRGTDPGTSSYDSIPGSGFNPMTNVTNPQGPGSIGNPQGPGVPPPYVGPWVSTDPEGPNDPNDPVQWDPDTFVPWLPPDCPPFDPTNPGGPDGPGVPDGPRVPGGDNGWDGPYETWTPDDPTGGGSTSWPRPGGVGVGGPGGFGGAVPGGGGGFAGGGGGSALVGGAGGGVALGGAKLMAGTRTGAGLVGGGGGMMGGAGGAGGAGGSTRGGSRGGLGAGASGAGRGTGAGAGRAGAMGAGGGGAAGGGSGTKSAGGRSGSGMMGGAGQGSNSDKKKRGVGMAGIVAPSLEGDDEIGARSQAAEAGGRAPIEGVDE